MVLCTNMHCTCRFQEYRLIVLYRQTHLIIKKQFTMHHMNWVENPYSASVKTTCLLHIDISYMPRVIDNRLYRNFWEIALCSYFITEENSSEILLLSFCLFFTSTSRNNTNFYKMHLKDLLKLLCSRWHLLSSEFIRFIFLQLERPSNKLLLEHWFLFFPQPRTKNLLIKFRTWIDSRCLLLSDLRKWSKFVSRTVGKKPRLQCEAS